MCGIAGVWNSNRPREDDLASVRDMLRAMRHRGPDGDGMLDYAGGAAGMVRLALVDLSPRGKQPMYGAGEQVAILFNGEVYNFREERARLEQKGYTFQSTTDTEVVLALYLEHGEDFVHSLRGMYAVAIFDWREGGRRSPPKLVLARDPFGIKPLYLHGGTEGKPLLFASEVRTLLASGVVPRAIDRDGLESFLTHGFVVQPLTMIEGVRMMEPGTLAVYRPGRPAETRSTYRLPPATDSAARTPEAAAAELRARLEESVRLHALADAPVGAFLSGGIDSTAIVGLMRPHLPQLHTFTLRFPDVPGADETREAAESARRHDCVHHDVDIDGAEVREVLPRFAHDIDQPSIDGLNTWLISRAAARHVKGVLSGLGGDEWFAGYSVTRRMARLASGPRGWLELAAGRIAAHGVGHLPRGPVRERVENLAARRSLVDLWLQGHRLFPSGRARELVGRPAGGAHGIRFGNLLDRVHPGWRDESAVGLSCILDTRYYMGSQLLRDSDATSMAHSLELRVPLVDREIVAFARSCPDAFKLAAGGGKGSAYAASGAKSVLIQAVSDLLPPRADHRPKRGFTLPFVTWLKGPLRELAEDTTGVAALRSRGLVDVDRLQRMGGPSDYPQRWGLMVLELWYRAVLSGSAEQPTAVAAVR